MNAVIINSQQYSEYGLQKFKYDLRGPHLNFSNSLSHSVK
ncbi:hypothetical protein VCRA2121O157_50217 [Vibrio crassostreae]|nr:hypothetical protein VCRA2119O145_110032 [Vibrio crassostreae]CAK1845592.1 hypothetical protein VCRA2110O173_10228 [Vibrio crassostreae]CAK1851206.1 hypothetical protein VCRA2113O356_10240 [Vibrio crassostreae]CAK1859701.1 hypothetical protein VCRA2110O175_10299 [Vibrio crassostreae]CAK1862222.1 hypothetical protein VCRA2113O221_10293 [Vibrio crassostreae]